MAPTRHVKIGDLTLGNDRPLTLIAGPCVLESRAHALEMSSHSDHCGDLTGSISVSGLWETKRVTSEISHQQTWRSISSELAFGIYRGEKTTKERKAFRRVLLELDNRTSAVRPVATAKTASDLLARKRGS